jgi:hypothetical protein
MPSKPKTEKYVPTSITLHPATLKKLRALLAPGESLSGLISDLVEDALDRIEAAKKRK